VGGEVLNLQTIFELNLFEVGVNALNRINTALIADKTGLVTVSNLQCIETVFDVLLEATIDLDDTPLACFMFIQNEAVLI
jgi:hypothetical protein